MQPCEYQQTLLRSFTLGGIGLHTGEYGQSPLSFFSPPDTPHSNPFHTLPWYFTKFTHHTTHTIQISAIVRVRPASAGEGRYFVRVPPGTNAPFFSLEAPKPVSKESLDIRSGVDDGLDDETRSVMYLQYLKEQDSGYDGSFGGRSWWYEGFYYIVLVSVVSVYWIFILCIYTPFFWSSI